MSAPATQDRLVDRYDCLSRGVEVVQSVFEAIRAGNLDGSAEHWKTCSTLINLAADSLDRTLAELENMEGAQHD